MKRMLYIGLSMAVLGVGAFMTGCSNGEKEAAAPTENEQKPENATGNTTEKKKVVALLYSRGFEFMVALDQGIQDEAAKQGIEITVLDGQSSSQTQIAQIEDNISKGVDAIILAPNNSDELVSGVKLANQAGIPVITVDGIVTAGCDIESAVSFDNHAGGMTGAETLISLLPNGGQVLECTGAAGYYHAVQRGGGFNDGMKTNNEFSVVTKDCQWSAENAQNVVMDILSSNSEIKGVFTHNDEMIRGVVAGLKQINRSVPVGEEEHIAVVGCDGTPIALDYIRSGEIDATIQQNPFEMGALAVEITGKVLNGEEVEAQYYVDPKVINKANVDDPTNWGNMMK